MIHDILPQRYSYLGRFGQSINDGNSRLVALIGRKVSVESEEGGTWVLDSDSTNLVCAHEHTEAETVEMDLVNPHGQDITYSREIEVCLDCGEEVM